LKETKKGAKETVINWLSKNMQKLSTDFLNRNKKTIQDTMTHRVIMRPNVTLQGALDNRIISNQCYSDDMWITATLFISVFAAILRKLLRDDLLHSRADAMLKMKKSEHVLTAAECTVETKASIYQTGARNRKQYF
jgi:uncharacterized protein YjhX (UPF0386 family)